MIKELRGDLLTTNASIIAHQVNCKGVMGAGVAKQIKNKIMSPDDFKVYQSICRTTPTYDLLGQVFFVQNTKNKQQFIANLFAENIPTGKKLDTDYDALKKALRALKRTSKGLHSIAIPGYLGCGLAGGDWNYVFEEILIPIFKNDNEITLQIYYLDTSINLLKQDYVKTAKMSAGDYIEKSWHGFPSGTKKNWIDNWFQKTFYSERITENGKAEIRKTSAGILFSVVHEINPEWGAYDEITARLQLDTYGCIYVDNYGKPIDNVEDLSEIEKSMNKIQKKKKYSISNELLRTLCIRNHWFSSGSNAQYEKLFQVNSEESNLEELALIIWLCTDTQTPKKDETVWTRETIKAALEKATGC